MRRAYLLVAVALCAVGLYFIADDLLTRSGNLFRGVGVLAGLTVLFVGAFHLLSYRYASVARGITAVACGASVALLASVAWLSWSSWDWKAVLTAALLLASVALPVVPGVRGGRADRERGPA